VRPIAIGGHLQPARVITPPTQATFDGFGPCSGRGFGFGSDFGFGASSAWRLGRLSPLRLSFDVDLSDDELLSAVFCRFFVSTVPFDLLRGALSSDALEERWGLTASFVLFARLPRPLSVALSFDEVDFCFRAGVIFGATVRVV
jgi:hypothetical protein